MTNDLEHSGYLDARPCRCLPFQVELLVVVALPAVMVVVQLVDAAVVGISITPVVLVKAG